MAYRKQSPDELRASVMRGALTRATTRLTVSGRIRGKDYQGDRPPPKVTLPKMPWDDEKETKE